MILYWMIAGCATGAIVARILRTRKSRKVYASLNAGQKNWLNTLARAHRG